MDVFVIPIGRDRYELYCETAAPVVTPGNGRGVVARWRARVSAWLHAAEERRQRGDQAAPDGSWSDRLQDRLMAWVAERVAEQRLLWNLRREVAVDVLHPDDMSGDQAQELIRRMLQRDAERHRRWMIVDGLAFFLSFIVLGPLFLIIPGIANLPALYFGFRLVGHWYSMRGAAAGRQRVAWRPAPSPRLTELRGLLDVAPRAREGRVREIAAHLRLRHLPMFFDRVAVRHA